MITDIYNYFKIIFIYKLLVNFTENVQNNEDSRFD